MPQHKCGGQRTTFRSVGARDGIQIVKLGDQHLYHPATSQAWRDLRFLKAIITTSEPFKVHQYSLSAYAHCSSSLNHLSIQDSMPSLAIQNNILILFKIKHSTQYISSMCPDDMMSTFITYILLCQVLAIRGFKRLSVRKHTSGL